MGVFDYYCLINGESCLLRDSQGQDCSFGEVYLVNQDLTKKLKAEYGGYGSAEFNGQEIFDLGFNEEFSLNDFKNVSYMSCTKCAKKIINKKKIDFKEKELNDLIIYRNEINKKIRNKRKEIEKLKN